MAAENEEKGEILILLSKVSAAQGKKDAFRTYAKKSIALGYKNSECYTLIGNLYMGSFKQCIEKGNPVKNRSKLSCSSCLVYSLIFKGVAITLPSF